MPGTRQPPRILTEPLAKLLAQELGLDYNTLPPTPTPIMRDGTRRSSVPLDQHKLRAITRRLIWAYLSQKSVG